MARTPLALVSKIIATLPNIPIPVPLHELATALDIIDFAELGTQGFEGGLLTNIERTDGIILVNKNANRRRKRFTIGHELGHFLIQSHRPVIPGQFLCRREDMQAWNTKHQDQYRRMEAEANEFSSLLLMPPPFLRTTIQAFKSPSVKVISKIADQFDVSKQAAARAYVRYADDPLAVLFIKDGIIKDSIVGKEFPYLSTKRGKLVSSSSSYIRDQKSTAQMRECRLPIWTDDERCRIFEESLYQRDGYGILLLWAQISEADEFDPEENMTSTQRWKSRIENRGGIR